MRYLLLLLSSAIVTLLHAQQSNHWVVQGYQEMVDTFCNLENLDTLKKTTYYDIDLNTPKITINKIYSNRIKYNYFDTPTTASPFKISQGYLTISNKKGNLLAYVFNNVLYNANGDSIDYLSQFGCKRGVASQISNTDTFTLYFIKSKTELNATSFENQYYIPINEPYNDKYNFHNDSFFLMEVKYFQNRRIGMKRISDFAKWGNISLMESNVVLFTNQFKEIKLQFVWDKFLYDINVSKNYFTVQKQITLHNPNETIHNFWYDNDYVQRSMPELVVSPSGRWTVYNWYFDKYINNTYKYSLTKVILITNNSELKFQEIASDSGNNENKTFKFWKNAVFTKFDSTFLIRTGQLNNIDVTWKILEVNIQGSKISQTYYDIQIDSQFNTVENLGIKYHTIRDLCLAPNGNNYVFYRKYLPKHLSNGSFIWIVGFELAKFIKKQSYYTIEEPINVFKGFNSVSLLFAGPNIDVDKIFFPATPTPYHKNEFSIKSLCNDLTYEFTNETDTNWFDHFTWFWGDGDSSLSVKSQIHIKHQYSNPGKYQVLLKSITANGGWVWYSDSIEILPEPIARYSTKNTVGCQWIAVEFHDSSLLENKSHTWHWNFGDDSDTIITAPENKMPVDRTIKHIYTTSGNFNVSLTVSDGRCTDTFQSIQNIHILPAPRPGIALNTTAGCSPLDLQFGRTYSDPTDSVNYRFKPAAHTSNYFNKTVNKAQLPFAGRYWLTQQLFGSSGCITQDSVYIHVTQGVQSGFKPFLKRSTVSSNSSNLIEWQWVPAAKNYQLYRNGIPIAVVHDTFYTDELGHEIDQSYSYAIQSIDSCDKTVALSSNVGKTIFLKVVQQSPMTINAFPTALLIWTSYKDWTQSGGIQNYVCAGNLDKETGNWQLLSNQADTQFNDKEFIERYKFEKCYRIRARSIDERFETESNTACLGYTATLFAPNAFTPNGDGLNDDFEIFNYGFDRFKLSIYNAWGQKIYEQSGAEANWRPDAGIPSGVYVYTVKASRENKEYTFSSMVTLIK